MDIILGTIQHLKQVKYLYAAVTQNLRSSGVFQWDRYYPNRCVISKDLKQEQMYTIIHANNCIGAVVVNEVLSHKYTGVIRKDLSGRPAVIHPLAVHPDYQGQGIVKKLLQVAEQWQNCKVSEVYVWMLLQEIQK
ncbi:GNAT family N-acetyltransferase [Paenibacillus sp. LjRoot153]|uniref:GNAT family N-acetyltransferase n=1 Tax=Paenibacillus sp. LjRoot153 TaxID=3342270 RepID=UPI003ECD402A